MTWNHLHMDSAHNSITVTPVKPYSSSISLLVSAKTAITTQTNPALLKEQKSPLSTWTMLRNVLEMKAGCYPRNSCPLFLNIHTGFPRANNLLINPYSPSAHTHLLFERMWASVWQTGILSLSQKKLLKTPKLCT